MNLKQQLSDALNQFAGFSSNQPQSVPLSAPDQVTITLDLTAVDQMSCALREIRVSVPALANADNDLLNQWAENLCNRVTYLLESLGPLELDPENQQVLIRSTPPDRKEGTTQFYEVILSVQSAGNFSLRRYHAEQGQSGRQQVDIQTTHELLHKLVHDLVDTIPQPA